MLLFDDGIDFDGRQSDNWVRLDSIDWISSADNDARVTVDLLSCLIHEYRIDTPDYIDLLTVD